jgi:hypothetical protein
MLFGASPEAVAEALHVTTYSSPRSQISFMTALLAPVWLAAGGVPRSIG